jgi:hypothetical protein
MTDKRIIEGLNFHFEYPGVDFHIAGRLGVVKDVRFVRCFWPSLDRPVALFAAGSSEIEVMGPPTPRNIVFPSDIVFLPQEADDGPANFGRGRKWRTTDIMTKRDCFFLRERRMQEVEVFDEVLEQIGHEGRMLNAKVMRPRKEMQPADIYTDLTVEQALEIAGQK